MGLSLVIDLADHVCLQFRKLDLSSVTAVLKWSIHTLVCTKNTIDENENQCRCFRLSLKTMDSMNQK